MKRKLIFVYNGDSGVLNSLVHLMHKTFSPSTYECRLCFLIYNGISLDKGWQAYIEQIGAEVTYCHRDTFAEQHGVSYPTYPLVLEQFGETYKVLIDATDFGTIDNLDALMSKLDARLGRLPAQSIGGISTPLPTASTR